MRRIPARPTRATDPRLEEATRYRRAMDARPLALAAGVALAAWLFVLLQRDLGRLGAGPEARIAASAAYAAMGAGWAWVLLGSGPTWLAWLGTAAAFAVTIAPRALLRLPRLASGRVVPVGGGIGRLPFLHRRTPEAQLAAEIGTIRMAMSTLTTSSHERGQLRARIRRLERWRMSSDPLARELVVLVAEAVEERLDGGAPDADDDRPAHDRQQRLHAPAGDARQRERRIRELLRQLGQ